MPSFRSYLTAKWGHLKMFFPFFFEAAMSAKINHITVYVITGLYETAEKPSNIYCIWTQPAAQVINARLFSGREQLWTLFILSSGPGGWSTWEGAASMWGGRCRSRLLHIPGSWVPWCTLTLEGLTGRGKDGSISFQESPATLLQGCLSTDGSHTLQVLAGGKKFLAKCLFCLPINWLSFNLLKGASQVVLVVKNLPASAGDMRLRFDLRFRKTPWRRAWQPTPAFFLRECHGQRSLASYSPQGHKESDVT